MTEELELRAVLGNLTLPQSQRKSAAAHLVKLLASSVTVPADNEEEVQKLMCPWPRTTPNEVWLADLSAKAMAELGMRNVVNGRSLDDARSAVQKQRQRARLLHIAGDPNEDALLRDAATVELGQSNVPRRA